jgi:NADH-quinone oxidoreductase subunit J
VELLGFVILTTLAVVSAVVVLLHRNPVIAALSLAANLIAIAGFYLLLNAQFLALLQVIVYAGAIMVLVLFTIMLLNLPDEARRRTRPSAQTVVGLVLAVAFVAVLAWTLARSSRGASFPQPGPAFGSVGAVGTALFTTYFYPFEAVSLLLIVAMIGAVLLAKRRI